MVGGCSAQPEPRSDEHTSKVRAAIRATWRGPRSQPCLLVDSQLRPSCFRATYLWLRSRHVKSNGTKKRRLASVPTTWNVPKGVSAARRARLSFRCPTHLISSCTPRSGRRFRTISVDWRVTSNYKATFAENGLCACSSRRSSVRGRLKWPPGALITGSARRQVCVTSVDVVLPKRRRVGVGAGGCLA